MSRPVPGEKLADLGPIWISERAAEEYAVARYRIRGAPRLSISEAHEELLWYLADAKQLRGAARSGASIWRRRTNSMRMDVEAHVEIPPDADEVRVTHVNVRPYHRGNPRGRRR